MRKKEFIDELRYNLEGKLSEQDIDEITSDYSDVFAGDEQKGRTEEETAERLGSPARIARTILEEDELKKREASMMGIDPRFAPFVGRQASMGSRFCAFILDGVLQVVLLFLAGAVFYMISAAIGGVGDVTFGNLGDFTRGLFLITIILSIFLCFFNILSVIFIWTTNGYTPGKWLLKIRVVKLNGQKISFMDAFMREFLIKSIANAITSGLLNIFSFIWGCVSDVNKTVHDLAAETTVVNEKRK